MYWPQEQQPRLRGDAVAEVRRKLETTRIDTGDEIKKRIPKICRRSTYLKKSNGFERKTKLVKTNLNQDLSVEEQFKISKNIVDLQDKLGVTIDQKNGQRKLGGPPPGWKGPPPDHNCEVFVGRIPRNIYEDVIYPVFSKIGKIYEIRLMMNFSGTNRGYCFVMYATRELAEKAIRLLNNYEIIPGWAIGVVPSVNNCRLHLTFLPNVDSTTIIKKVWPLCEDIDKILIYTHLNNQKRKEAIIYFETHRSAAMARRRLLPQRNTLFQKCNIRIEWAVPDITLIGVIEECGVYYNDENIIITKRIIKSDKDNFSEDELKSNNRKKKLLPNSSKYYSGLKKPSQDPTSERSNYKVNINNNVLPYTISQNHGRQDLSDSSESFTDKSKFYCQSTNNCLIRSDESLSTLSKTSDCDDCRYGNNLNVSPQCYIPMYLNPKNCSVVKYPWGLSDSSNYYFNAPQNFYTMRFPWNQVSSFVNNNVPVQAPMMQQHQKMIPQNNFNIYNNFRMNISNHDTSRLGNLNNPTFIT